MFLQIQSWRTRKVQTDLNLHHVSWWFKWTEGGWWQQRQQQHNTTAAALCWWSCELKSDSSLVGTRMWTERKQTSESVWSFVCVKLRFETPWKKCERGARQRRPHRSAEPQRLWGCDGNTGVSSEPFRSENMKRKYSEVNGMNNKSCPEQWACFFTEDLLVFFSASELIPCGCRGRCCSLSYIVAPSKSLNIVWK